MDVQIPGKIFVETEVSVKFLMETLINKPQYDKLHVSKSIYSNQPLETKAFSLLTQDLKKTMYVVQLVDQHVEKNVTSCKSFMFIRLPIMQIKVFFD